MSSAQRRRRGRALAWVVGGLALIAVVVGAALLAPAVLFAGFSPVGTFTLEPSSLLVEVQSDSQALVARLSSSLATNMRANLAEGFVEPHTGETTSHSGIWFAQHFSAASLHMFTSADQGATAGASPLAFDTFIEDMNVLLPGLLSGAPADTTRVVIRYGLPDGSTVRVAQVEYVDGVARFVTSQEPFTHK